MQAPKGSSKETIVAISKLTEHINCSRTQCCYQWNETCLYNIKYDNIARADAVKQRYRACRDGQRLRKGGCIQECQWQRAG